MKDEIPDSITIPVLILVSVISWGFFFCNAYKYINYQPPLKNVPEARFERHYTLIEGNSLKAHISPNTYTGTKITRVITGYSSTPDQTDDTPFITASGKSVEKGIIATNEFPFGTKIMIDGCIYTVEDRMNSRYNSRIDIWFPTRQEAREWGRQVKEVILLN